MTITTLSSREFNQDASNAKRASLRGPVIITDRGKPAHVLLSFAQYQQITHTSSKIADLLAMPGSLGAELDGVDAEIPTLNDLAQAADFS